MRRIHGVQLRHPLPFDAVLLGDLTLNPGIPANDVRSYPADQPALSIHHNYLRNLQELGSTEIGGNISAQFQAVLQAQLHARQQRSTEVEAPLATKYMIRNSTDAFENACRDPQIKMWLNKYCVDQGRPAAFIVGMYSYSDATYSHRRETAAGTSAGATDPTSTTALGVQAAISDTEAARTTYTMPDEQIFAIEYRSLAWKIFQKKNVEGATLAKNRWEIFSGDRSKGAGQDHESLVEFELGNDEFEDLSDGEVIPLGSMDSSDGAT
ncbi:hypothetical protein MMC24_003889 [Lignoscripta atroalba]|nr:hypothetical protein [Lignoscripta atroalba]